MTLADLGPWANHLWQSTLFTGAAALLAWALRKDRAAARFGLWMAASLKFLIPFSVVVKAGSRLAWIPMAPAAPRTGFSVAVGEMSEPFARATASLAPAAASVNWLPATLIALWAAGAAVVAFNWWRRWSRLRATFRASSPLALEGLDLAARSCRSLAEPGVFGIFRAVLLVPDGMVDRLAPAQFAAILAHERCHVRRRDNLWAAMHMLVEAIFWFHPLVWWVERQLVRERERACDEEVLRLGSDPEAYAEGILRVCQWYVESSLVCAAGVTGIDLKNRIEEIMTRRTTHPLSAGKKLLLAAAGAAAVAAPLAV